MNNDFDDFEKDLLEMTTKFNKGKESKKFLKKQARKLNRLQRKKVEELTKKNTKSKVQKHLRDPSSFKAGRPYKHSSDLSVRAYSNFPTAHLINNGHIIRARGAIYKGGQRRGSRRGKTREIGFVKGVYFMEKAQKGFIEKNFEDTKKFIDDMLQKHGFV